MEVLHFGAPLSFKGKQGLYLSAVASNSPNSNGGGSNNNANASYVLGVHGQGIGEEKDAMVLVNVDHRYDDNSTHISTLFICPLCYNLLCYP